MTNQEEENNPINEPETPLTGDIEDNFGGIDEERKKKIRKQLLFWGGISLGVIVIVTLIIIIILVKGGDDAKNDNSPESGPNPKPGPNPEPTDSDEKPIPPGVYGNIIASYDVKVGNVKLVSDDFEKTFDIIMYVGGIEKNYSKEYNFDIDDSKTVRKFL